MISVFLDEIELKRKDLESALRGRVALDVKGGRPSRSISPIRKGKYIAIARPDKGVSRLKV